MSLKRTSIATSAFRTESRQRRRLAPLNGNPTQTILALSMRNAAHLADMARRRELSAR